MIYNGPGKELKEPKLYIGYKNGEGRYITVMAGVVKTMVNLRVYTHPKDSALCSFNGLFSGQTQATFGRASILFVKTSEIHIFI